MEEEEKEISLCSEFRLTHIYIYTLGASLSLFILLIFLEYLVYTLAFLDACVYIYQLPELSNYMWALYRVTAPSD